MRSVILQGTGWAKITRVFHGSHVFLKMLLRLPALFVLSLKSSLPHTLLLQLLGALGTARDRATVTWRPPSLSGGSRCGRSILPVLGLLLPSGDHRFPATLPPAAPSHYPLAFAEGQLFTAPRPQGAVLTPPLPPWPLRGQRFSLNCSLSAAEHGLVCLPCDLLSCGGHRGPGSPLLTAGPGFWLTSVFSCLPQG